MQKIITLITVLVFTGQLVLAQTFTLKSDDLGGHATNEQVFNGFGCSGENISPQLSWENAPEGTKSFAVTIYDEDAPTGSGWWHWLIFNIPTDVNQLSSGAGNVENDKAPEGVVQSRTSFGKAGYGGPCPPKGHGLHKYTITVYALDTESLDLDENATPALVGFYLNQHAISKASIIFYYGREE